MALPDMIVRIGLDSSDFVNKMREIRSDIQSVSKDLSGIAQVGSTLTQFGMTMTAALSVPLAGIGYAAFEARAKMEQLSNGLLAVSGSAEKAARLLNIVKDAAKLPGLTFEDAARGAINLTAVGMSAEQVDRILRSFGNALAAVGRGGEDLSAVVVQLTQMASKSQVVAGDLKPILERVPQAVNIIKEAYGTLDTELLQKNKVSTQEFIEVLVSGLEKLPQAASTARNEMDNARDAIWLAMSQIGAAIAPVAVAIAQTLVPAVQAIGDAFGALPSPVQQTIVGLGLLVAAIGPAALAIGQVITAVRTITLGITALQGVLAASAAWSTFTAAVSAAAGAVGAFLVPVGLVALKVAAITAVIGGAIYGIAKLGEHIFGAGSAFGWLADKIEGAFAAVKNWITGNKEAKEKQQQATQATEQHAKAVEHTTVVTKGQADAQKTLQKELDDMRDAMIKARTAALQTDVTWRALIKATDEQLDSWRKAREALIEYKARLMQGKDAAWAMEEANRSFDKTLQDVDRALKAAGKSMNDFRTASAPALISTVPDLTKAADDLAKAWKTLGLPSPSEIEQKKKQVQDAYEEIRKSGIYSADELQRAYQRMTDELNKMPGSIASAWKTLGLPSPAEREEKIRALREAYEQIRNSGTASAEDIKRAYDAMQKGVADAVGDKNKKGSLVETVSTAVTNFTQEMAKSLWEGDMSFGERVKKMLVNLGEAITTVLLEPWTKAFTDWVTGIITRVFHPLHDAVADLAAGAVRALTGAAGGAAGAVGGAAGAGAAGAAGAGAAGAAGAGAGAAGAVSGIATGLIGGGIAAIGSIIGSFITSSRLGGDLGKIEENTRFTQIALIGPKGVIDILWHLSDHFWAARGLLTSISEYAGWAWELASQATPVALDRLMEVRDRLIDLPDRMRPLSITIEGNVIGNEEFLDYMTREIGRRLSAQGA